MKRRRFIGAWPWFMENRGGPNRWKAAAFGRWNIENRDRRSKMAWRQIISNRLGVSWQPGLPRYFSKSTPYIVKVGIPEFLNGIGKGVETHVAKLETEIGDFQKLLVTRTLRLKKLGIPCKHRKLILRYTHKYRLGLWRPRADAVKSHS